MTIASPNATQPWFVGGEKVPRVTLALSADALTGDALPAQMTVGVYEPSMYGPRLRVAMDLARDELVASVADTADRSVTIDFEKLAARAVEDDEKRPLDGQYMVIVKSKPQRRFARAKTIAKSKKFRLLNGKLWVVHRAKRNDPR